MILEVLQHRPRWVHPNKGLNPRWLIGLACLAWAALSILPIAFAADADRPGPDWKELSPEERQARILDYKRRHKDPLFSRAEIEARRQELRNLPPEERRARIREWREKNGGLRFRLEGQLLELRQKRDEGTLTTEDARRLERLEVLSKRFDQARRQSNRPSKQARPPQDAPPNPK